MTEQHPNAMLIRQAWLAVSHSDIETLRELWDEKIVWHVTGENPWQGDHVGQDAVFEYLAQVGDESGEAYTTELIDVLAGDDYAGLMCRVSSQRGDRKLEVDQLLLGRIKNRRIVEVWTLSCDPQAIKSFWA
jgi:hypothetical protein